MCGVCTTMDQVKNIVLVLSGKGGVGKSTVAVNLAVALVRAGKRVGLLDVDLCGPSLPTVLGVGDSAVHQSSAGWVPVFTDSTKRLCVMSIGFLLPKRDAPVVWRGPKKTAMIRQFVNDVVWGELDYVIVDTPPGTSDEHMAITEHLRQWNPRGAVLVTTPQNVALSDVRREITFCNKIALPILGLVENMSGFVCPHCAECTNIFSSGGGSALAEHRNVPFIGSIPIDPSLQVASESNADLLERFPAAESLSVLESFAKRLVAEEGNGSPEKGIDGASVPSQ